jgi:uncharacterized membrane protein (Fun14 family)
MLWLAMLLTVVGVAWWGWNWYASASAPPAPAPVSASPLAGGLVAGPAAASAPASATDRTPPAPPMAVRIGASFMAGFFLAWLLRRVVAWTILVGGAIAVGIGVLKTTGVVEFDWTSVESQVDAGLEQVKESTKAASDWVRAFLPSGASAVVGMFFGARR